MEKFKESELTKNLQPFQEKTTIELEFEKSINGKLILEDTTVNYDSQNGFINIESKNGKFKINTTLVYGYRKENKTIYIDLDSLLLGFKNK